MNCIADLMDALHISQYPLRWEYLYKSAMKEYERRGGFFAEQEYLLSLHKEYHLFERTLNEVMRAADKLRDKPILMQYIMLINFAMKDRDAFWQENATLEPPEAPEGEDTVPYDFALIFAVLPTVNETAKSLYAHGVPQDICYATFAGYEDSMLAFRTRYDRLGFDQRYLNWTQLYIDAKILRIGRLNFEMCTRFDAGVQVFKNKNGETCMLATNIRMHRDGMILGTPGFEDEIGAYDSNFLETDDYFEGYPIGNDGLAKKQRIRLIKSTWKTILRPDEPVINVHIPADGKLSEKLCESAYSRAREIFASCYPEFKYKAFACFSWLMDPQLAKLLPKDSKIVIFQSKYARFPCLSFGKSVLHFVFDYHFDCYKNLPENTSLERSLKQHYLSGKYIYEQGGVFF